MRRFAFCLAAIAVLAIPLVTHAADGDEKEFAYSVVDRNAVPMAQLGDSVYYFGELGMQEVQSTKMLKDTLEAGGFTVELGGAGMPTNLWAKWGSGHPYIVIVSEIDALPGGSQKPGELARDPLVPGAPGHMEGHNVHAGLVSGAAFAVKETLQRYHLPGTVGISLGPAEEELASRPFIVRAGYFKDVDAIIYVHIGDGLSTGYGLANYAAISADFAFHGKTAHGGVDPWDAKDALDAVELMDDGAAFLRQQLHPTYRMHRVITNGGVQPNVIPDLTGAWWFVRDANMADAKQTFDKLVNVAKGAALMTATTVDYNVKAEAWPQLDIKAIAEDIQKNIDAVGMPKWTDEEQSFARSLQKFDEKPEVGLKTAVTPLGERQQGSSSNDSGDISWVVPAGALSFPSAVPGIAAHEWHAAIAPTSTIAHKGMVAGAKVLAASVLDLMTTPALLTEAHAQWEAATKKTPYFAVLPPDAKPPIDLNKDTMAQYRPAMSKFYLNLQPRFQ